MYIYNRLMEGLISPQASTTKLYQRTTKKKISTNPKNSSVAFLYPWLVGGGGNLQFFGNTFLTFKENLSFWA